jgi:hypothetical protein
VYLHFKPDSKIILSEKGPKQYEHCNSMIIQPHNSQRNTALLLSDIIGDADADEHLSVSTTISIWIPVCDYYYSTAARRAPFIC